MQNWFSLIFAGKSQFYACHVAIKLCLYFILLVKRFNDHLIKKITMTGVKLHEDLPMLFTHGIWPKYSFLWETGNRLQELNFEILLSQQITRCQKRRQSNFYVVLKCLQQIALTVSTHNIIIAYLVCYEYHYVIKLSLKFRASTFAKNMNNFLQT